MASYLVFFASLRPGGSSISALAKTVRNIHFPQIHPRPWLFYCVSARVLSNVKAWRVKSIGRRSLSKSGATHWEKLNRGFCCLARRLSLCIREWKYAGEGVVNPPSPHLGPPRFVFPSSLARDVPRRGGVFQFFEGEIYDPVFSFSGDLSLLFV